MISRALPALILASCACTMTVEKRDDGAPARGAATAEADRGPMAPDPAGKPVRFALDGVEMGMSLEEVKKVWGKPASSSDDAHLRYVDKAGYAKVYLAGGGTPLVLVRFELFTKEGAEPMKADAMAQLTRQFGPPVTDAQELGLKSINRSDETRTLFRAARYAYAVAWWLPDFKQEGVIRLWKVEVALHPGDILAVPSTEWTSLRWPIPWAPVGSLKAKVETLETGKATKPSDVEAVLGPPVRVHRNESGYDIWEYWFWKQGPRAEFQFQDGVLYGRGVNE